MVKLLNKKWKWFVLVLIIISGFLLYRWLFHACGDCGPRNDALTLRTQCESAGGFFVEALEQCQLPTADAGKACADSSTCEGFCEAELSSAEISKIANGEPVEKTGACGQWKNFYSGCFYVVENGKVERFCAD